MPQDVSDADDETTALLVDNVWCHWPTANLHCWSAEGIRW